MDSDGVNTVRVRLYHLFNGRYVWHLLDREANRESWLALYGLGARAGWCSRPICEMHELNLSTLSYWSRHEQGTVGGVKMVPVKVEGMSPPSLVLRSA